jgi:hypothetical protein
MIGLSKHDLEPMIFRGESAARLVCHAQIESERPQRGYDQVQRFPLRLTTGRTVDVEAMGPVAVI